ncbi:hypothetical protein AMTR_s00084p00159360 [Amborella trichopoda]|uniref:Uncharacterized protein n=1 Tax=Amborella trichopoda TaxID=13333 RepID=W1P3V0_AMBTC|nr:hypothetical protein AMTR_s00084p00159360 [Amborella trichopoda]
MVLQRKRILIGQRCRILKSTEDGKTMLYHEKVHSSPTSSTLALKTSVEGALGH